MQIPIIIQQGYVNMHLLTDVASWMADKSKNKVSNHKLVSYCHQCHSLSQQLSILSTGEKAQCCQCYEDYICPRVNDSTASNNYEKHTHTYTHTRIYSTVFVFFT